jgi:6-phosphogluconolactonase
MKMDKLVRVFATLDELYQAAADHFAEVVKQAVRSRGEVFVTLSGGGTPQRLFQLLARPPYQISIPWDVIHFYWGDERCVPPEHPESNFGQVKKILLDRVPVRLENIHRVNGELTPEKAAENYLRQLAKNGTAEQPWPKMDYTLMGMGADGHTASLFPRKENPEEKISPVITVSAEYEGRPAERVTLTPEVFNTSRNVVFLVTGADKATALSAVLNEPFDPINFPAQRIQPASGTLTWMVDSLASRLINKGKQV